jgi:uncharacterized protein YjbK
MLGIDYKTDIQNVLQQDTYYDTKDHALLNNKNSLRIRIVDAREQMITSKHFVSLDASGQHHRIEDNEYIALGENKIEALFKHAENYFSGMQIEQEPVVMVNNNRTSFIIRTKLAGYTFCLDKFYFLNINDNTKSDDFYEIEVEENGAEDKAHSKDSQLEQLSVVFKDVFGFIPSEKNKYARGVAWLRNPVNQRNMQFVIFDIVDYSMYSSPK